MTIRRVASLTSLWLAVAGYPASGQSVVSTHSGLVYFFEGNVFLGNDQLEQKFGKFPDIGEGRQLRTEKGRAEVLLTPNVFLRLSENSAIRMISSNLSDTQVELLRGSGILESSASAATLPVTLIYKNWQVRFPGQTVFRIDCDPPQIKVYQGEAQVTGEGDSEAVTVSERQALPLNAVLVPDPNGVAQNDEFKTWAMSRSQSISSDNATAAAIVDDPTQVDGSLAGLGGMGGLTYFPMSGLPGVALSSPYGLSFWSPFQSTLGSIYAPTFLYASIYPGWGWPSAIRSPLWRRTGIYTSVPVGGIRPIGSGLGGIGIGGIGVGGLRPIGVTSPRVPYIPPVRTSRPAVAAPHVGVHAPVGHR